MLIELIEHDFRNDVTAQFNHDAHTLPVRFIAQVRNAFQGLILHQMSNTLNEAGFIDLIRISVTTIRFLFLGIGST